MVILCKLLMVSFEFQAFNTFIDDVFAFIISMPTAHRLACFRDDLVFVVYLYQRWWGCCCVGSLLSQQCASVSQGWICSDNSTCSYSEKEVTYQAVYLTQSQYTDTWPTSPSTDLISRGIWQGSHQSTCMTLEKDPWQKQESNLGLPLFKGRPYH